MIQIASIPSEEGKSTLLFVLWPHVNVRWEIGQGRHRF